jgi:hypothetical protein
MAESPGPFEVEGVVRAVGASIDLPREFFRFFYGPEVARLHSRDEARRNDLGNSKPHSDTFGVEFPNAHSDRSEKSLKSRRSRQSSYPTRPFERISVLKKLTSSLIDVH